MGKTVKFVELAPVITVEGESEENDTRISSGKIETDSFLEKKSHDTAPSPANSTKSLQNYNQFRVFLAFVVATAVFTVAILFLYGSSHNDTPQVYISCNGTINESKNQSNSLKYQQKPKIWPSFFSS